MPRLRRLFLPNVPCHLIVRGNDRQDIFRSDSDRLFFLRCLLESTRSNAVSVHSYVLMTNHVHLMASTPQEAGISRVIQSVGRRYVGYFNDRYERTGTLWEGRFRSTLVGTERYLVNCQRYIELNPVRAGLVADPIEYPWSSHAHFASGRPDDLVTPHSYFASMVSGESYRELFGNPLTESEIQEIRDCTNKGWVLGDAPFSTRAELETSRRARPLVRGWVKGRLRGKLTRRRNKGV